jgi:hypothetical protein
MPAKQHSWLETGNLCAPSFALRELAEDRRRWGYRRLHVLLRREGWMVNRKQVYRIYVEEKLIVHRRKRRRRICAQARVLLAAPVGKNETWTMDFFRMRWPPAASCAPCRSKTHTPGRCWPSRSIPMENGYIEASTASSAKSA